MRVPSWHAPPNMHVRTRRRARLKSHTWETGEKGGQVVNGLEGGGDCWPNGASHAQPGYHTCWGKSGGSGSGVPGQLNRGGGLTHFTCFQQARRHNLTQGVLLPVRTGAAGGWAAGGWAAAGA
eukprot:351955-Chlamydomonas_euryale.AAC.2